MSLFASPFFSLSGQKERFSNAYEVLKIAANPFSKDNITANVKNPTGKAALEFVANNPYTTAAVATAGAAPLTRAAIAESVTGLSTTTKVVGSAAAIVGIPALASSERLRVGAINTVSNATPEKLAKFGQDTGLVVEDPSKENLKDYFKENAGLIATGIGLGVLAGGGKAAGIAATSLSVIATERNTEAMTGSGSNPSLPASQASVPQISSTTSNPSASPVPITRETQVLGREPTSSRNRRRASPKKKESTTNVRVNVLNQQTYIAPR